MNRGFAPDLSVYAFSVATTKQEKPKKSWNEAKITVTLHQQK